MTTIVVQNIIRLLQEQKDMSKKKGVVFDWANEDSYRLVDMLATIEELLTSFLSQDEIDKRKTIKEIKRNTETTGYELFGLLGFEYPRFLIANPALIEESKDRVRLCLIAVALAYNFMDWRDSTVTLQLICERALAFEYDLIGALAQLVPRILDDEYHPSMKNLSARKALVNLSNLIINGKIGSRVSDKSSEFFLAFVRSNV